jgi:hypothetical protein
MRSGQIENHLAVAPSNAIMWLVLARTPRPDAPYWPGRRLLAFADAVIWPVGWIVLAAHMPPPVGIVGPMVIALAALSAISRAHRAVMYNERYHFTSWRWGRIVFALLLLGAVIKLTVAT